MMDRFQALADALRHGSALADPATWKRRQNLVNALVGLLGAVVVIAQSAGVQVDFSTDDVALVAGGVAAIYGAVNAYLTTATSEKIGVGQAKEG